MSRNRLNMILICFIIYCINIRTQALNSSLFISSFSSCVTGALARNETECNLLNTIDNYCCYLSSFNQTGTGFCLSLDQSKYTGMKTVYYNQTNYSIYCGFGSSNALLNSPATSGNTCFKVNPKTYEECYLNSTDTNSCCYYSYSGISGCYWLGTNYLGSTDVNGITMICSMSFTKHSYCFILFILMIIILN
jgi:hypothetical protein